MLRKEHRLMIFENRVWRTIFGPKRVPIISGCKKLHTEKQYFPKYNLNDQIKEDEMHKAYNMHGREEEWMQGLSGKSLRKVTTRKTYTYYYYYYLWGGTESLGICSSP
jgi:hypothetical protein